MFYFTSLLIFLNKKNTNKLNYFNNLLFFKSLNLHTKIDYNIFYDSFKTLFFFCTILNLKKKKKKISLDKYAYDLIFRFPNLSLTNLAVSLNFLLGDSRKKNFTFKSINNNDLYYKLPATAALNDNFSIIFKRSVFLTVGSFKYLPMNYTKSGYFTPFIIREKKEQFFSNIGYFFLTLKYEFAEKKLNPAYFSLKSLFVFDSQVPNINLNILFFVLSSKKTDFLKYSNFDKEYNIFLTKNKNTELEKSFLNLSWISKDLNDGNTVNNIKNINIQTKHKYLLKFHRNSFNSIFGFRYKSNKLSKIFKKISKKKLTFFFKNLYLELSLVFLIIRAKFGLNLDHSNWLINNGYVFINGVVCFNKDFVLKKNDRIQFLIEKNEFSYIRELESRCNTRLFRMFYTYNKYNLVLSQPYKTQPTSKKKWILKSLWNTTDVPKYLEVDYITSTIFIIYEPISYRDFFPFFLTELRSDIITLYNWKYLY